MNVIITPNNVCKTFSKAEKNPKLKEILYSKLLSSLFYRALHPAGGSTLLQNNPKLARFVCDLR